jgi:hypothetical protein
MTVVEKIWTIVDGLVVQELAFALPESIFPYADDEMNTSSSLEGRKVEDIWKLLVKNRYGERVVPGNAYSN